MDLRVVHPIPLTVADVMSKFHVLDALRDGQGGGSNRPANLAPAATDAGACGEVDASLKRDDAPIYALSLAPRESSMSRRIASNWAARASMSASLRWAYSATSAMAIDASRTFRRGGLPTYSRDDAQPGEIG